MNGERCNGQRATGNGQRATGNGQRATGNGQRATGNGQRANLCELYPVSTGKLPSMFDVQCSMFGVQCSMFNVQCSMFNVQCSMFNVQCSMFNVQCSMFNVQCSMFNVQLSFQQHHFLAEHASLSIGCFVLKLIDIHATALRLAGIVASVPGGLMLPCR